MTFFMSALALLAIFRVVWNLGVPLVSFVGGVGGLIAERKFGMNIAGIEDGAEFAGQAWKWLGALLLAVLLAAFAWGAGSPGGQVVPYVAVGAVLIWHMFYVGGHAVRQEGFRRGDRRGVEVGNRDIRLSWVPALAVVGFGGFPAVALNPLTVAVFRAWDWALDHTVLRFIVGAVAVAYLVHFVITSGSMVWTGYRSLRVHREASRAPGGARSVETVPLDPVVAQQAAPPVTTVVVCSACGQQLRLPAGKGRLMVTCPKCTTRQAVTT